MQTLLTTLIPPFLVLLIAGYTHKLESALITGLVSACLLATNFNIFNTVQLIVHHLYEHILDPDYLLLFGFLCIIGILVELIVKSGVAQSAASWMFYNIGSKRQAEFATVGLSSLLCIDDYLSSLTTGTVMSLVTDRFQIPRWRTAYLVHSLASPLVILMPLSSWLAMITTQIESSGISLDTAENPLIVADPFWAYLAAIPYIFYSFILIGSVLVTIFLQLSPVPATVAPSSTSLPASKAPQQRIINGTSIWELAYPLIMLFSLTLFGLLWTGGYRPFGTISLMSAIKQSGSSSLILLCAGTFATLVTAIRLTKTKLLNVRQLPNCIIAGIQLMLPAIIMIVLAGSLGDAMRDDLHVGQHLFALLSYGTLTWAIPVTAFLVSMTIGVITGSSWGTIMLIMPLTLPIVIALEGGSILSLAETVLVLPTIGAIFSGAVCGDHVSPISETTIMAATSCGLAPMLHARTQFYFVFPAIIGTIASYTLWGMLGQLHPTLRLLTSLASGFALSVLLLLFTSKRQATASGEQK